MKLKLGKPRTNEEALKLHKETNDESERQAKLAEAAQAYSQGGKKAIREMLERQQRERQGDEPEQA